MKKITSVLLALVMAVLCCAAALPVLAADETQNPSLALPVEIALSGAVPTTAEDYTVKLTPNEEGNPMPANNTADGVYTRVFTGATQTTLDVIQYDHVGIYSYTLVQVPGTNAKCSYDATVYYIEVSVTNKVDEDGNLLGGYDLTCAVHLTDKNGEKVAPTALFTNTYAADPTPTPAPATPAPTAVPTATPAPSALPKTGDNFPLVALGVIAVIAAAGFGFVAYRKKKGSEK